MPQPMPTLDVARPTGIERRAAVARVGGSVLLLAPVVAAFFVYAAITRNYFYADDFILFYDVVNYGPLAFLLTPYGGHLQIARNLVFLASAHLFGPNPMPFYWVVLLTHLANVALLFHVVRLLTGSALLACAGALLWGTSPLNEASLGWYAVYGHVMATTVLLVLLALWGRAMVAARVPDTRMLALSLILALVGSTCFGVGLGIALALPVVFVVLFPASSVRARLTMASLWVLIPAFYAATHALHSLVSTRWVPGASPLGALQHGRGVLALLVHLVGHGLGGLVLGFTAVPTAHPWLVAGVGATAGLVVVAALAAPRRDAPPTSRRLLLALVLLVLAIYGSIAAARAPSLWFFRSGSFAALAATGRYHYVGPVCLVLLLSVAVRALVPRARVGPASVTALGALAAFVLGSWVWSGWRIDHHDGERAVTEQMLAKMASAAAKAPPGGTVYLPNERFDGVGPMFLLFPKLFPRAAGVFLVFHPEGTIDGRKFRFVENDPKALEKLTADPRLPIAALVVAPGKAPAP